MYQFTGIKFGGPSCYNNGLCGEGRVVFFSEHYFMLPDGFDPDKGYHLLYVGFGPHVCKAGLKFAGQYKTLEELTRAMLMMLGSDELRHEYGPVIATKEYAERIGSDIGQMFHMSYA